MPSTLASIASSFSPAVSFDEFWKRRNPVQEDLWDKYEDQLWSSRLDDNTLRAKSEFYTEHLERWESRREERVKYRASQVHRARAITSLSPATLLQHLIEAFAGTGFERHLQFVENTQRYARQFREFIVTTPTEPIQRVAISLVFVRVCRRNLSAQRLSRDLKTRSASVKTSIRLRWRCCC